MGKYNTQHLETECSLKGLKWNQEIFDFADQFFKEAGLTQEQVDIIVRCYMNIIIHLFDPKAYSVLGRLGLAFHFLFGKRPGHDQR